MSLHGLFLTVNSTTNRDHIAVYVCREHERAAGFAANREIADVAWFAATNLPEAVTPGTARRIGEVFGSLPPDPLW
jgi:hypothetical protein